MPENENDPVVRGLELSVYSTDSLGEERGCRLNQLLVATDLTNHAYRRSLHKIPKGQGLDNFQGGEHVEVLVEWCPPREQGTSTPLLQTVPYASLPSNCS